METNLDHLPETLTWTELMERRRARDRRDGLKHLTHEGGLCGMAVAACCGDCLDDELIWMRGEYADAPDPVADENISEYWRRIGGKFYDAWYEAARERFKSAGVAWT